MRGNPVSAYQATPCCEKFATFLSSSSWLAIANDYPKWADLFAYRSNVFDFRDSLRLESGIDGLVFIHFLTGSLVPSSLSLLP